MSSLIGVIQARTLLGTQAQHVEHLVEEGFLTPEIAEDYLETIRHDIQRLEKVKYEKNRQYLEYILDLIYDFREDVKLRNEAHDTDRILPRELYANLRMPQHHIKSLDGPSTHPAVLSTELVDRRI